MAKLLILDANSIINRAYYGIRPLSARDGTPTNAIYGFINILIKLINDEEPDMLCAAFDLKAPTFRHKMYDQYKAQRKPMPQDLAVQLPLAKELLSLMGVTLLEKEGFEADDIIGTVSKLCEENGIDCMIATGDKDDLQLASDKTRVILTVSRMGTTTTTVYDDKAVLEKYGVTPREFIDVKALMGDQSDNIPGVSGIGEKTAVKLIAAMGSIENIYDNIEEAPVKGVMLKRLTEGRESAFMSKELATIVRDVPLELDFSKCAFDGFKYSEKLYSELKRLELNSVLKRLDFSGEKTAEAPRAETKTVSSPEEFLKLEFSGEVSSLLKFSAGRLLWAAVSNGKKSWYLSGMDEEDIIRALKPLLEDETVGKIVFDCKDALVKLAGKCRISPVTDDVAIMSYLANPAKGASAIEDLAGEYLGRDMQSEEEFLSGTQEQMTLLEEEPEDGAGAAEFFGERAAVLIQLRDALAGSLREFEQEELYRKIELPLIQVLADMQLDGFLIDKQQLSQFGEYLTGKIEGLTKEIYDSAGEEFNINSPKQLGEILFDKLGMKAGRRNQRGYSTSAEVLEKLRGEHPIIDEVLEYRQLAKLKSTYCDGLAAVISEKDGRIHSVFNQTVTVTGRISSTEPNMQNIPTRTALGRELRKMFIAPQGKILVDADYSQIELRVLAHIAGDDTMIEAFNSGEDIHRVTASQVFGVPADEVTDSQRRSAKAVNFGIVYGIGEFSLAQDLKIPVAMAKRYIDSYLEKYHGVREYMKNIKEQAKADGYVKTLMNRVRYIPELKSPNYNLRAFGERVALNTPIQGTAADIIKLAMVRVHRRLEEEKLRSRLILQVHDELIIEAFEEEAEEVERILREEMENAMELKVPLVVDMSRGKSWYDAK